MPDYVPLGTDPYSAHQLLIRHCDGASVVLDVGCSAGTIARELVRRGAVVDGIEFDPEAAREAGAPGGCRRVTVGDVESMDLGDFEPGAYDVVLMADLIEHLNRPDAALRRFRPLLKPGGRLILSTPNIANWSMRLLHLAGRWEYQDRGLMDRTHVHFFTLRSLLRALRDAGYRVRQVDVTCPLPALRRWPFNAAAHRLALAWKALFAYQFIVIASADHDRHIVE